MIKYLNDIQDGSLSDVNIPWNEIENNEDNFTENHENEYDGTVFMQIHLTYKAGFLMRMKNLIFLMMNKIIMKVTFTLIQQKRSDNSIQKEQRQQKQDNDKEAKPA